MSTNWNRFRFVARLYKSTQLFCVENAKCFSSPKILYLELSLNAFVADFVSLSKVCVVHSTELTLLKCSEFQTSCILTFSLLGRFERRFHSLTYQQIAHDPDAGEQHHQLLYCTNHWQIHNSDSLIHSIQTVNIWQNLLIKMCDDNHISTRHAHCIQRHRQCTSICHSLCYYHPLFVSNNEHTTKRDLTKPCPLFQRTIIVLYATER